MCKHLYSKEVCGVCLSKSALIEHHLSIFTFNKRKLIFRMTRWITALWNILLFYKKYITFILSLLDHCYHYLCCSLGVEGKGDFIEVIYLCQAWKWTESNSSSYIKDALIALLPFKWLSTVVHIRAISSEMLQRVDSPCCLLDSKSLFAAERKEQRLCLAWKAIRRVSEKLYHEECGVQLVGWKIHILHTLWWSVLLDHSTRDCSFC